MFDKLTWDESCKLSHKLSSGAFKASLKLAKTPENICLIGEIKELWNMNHNHAQSVVPAKYKRSQHSE